MNDQNINIAHDMLQIPIWGNLRAKLLLCRLYCWKKIFGQAKNLKDKVSHLL